MISQVSCEFDRSLDFGPPRVLLMTSIFQHFICGKACLELSAGATLGHTTPPGNNQCGWQQAVEGRLGRSAHIPVLLCLAARLPPCGRFQPCPSSSMACLVKTSTSPTVSLISWCSSRQVSAAFGRSRTCLREVLPLLFGSSFCFVRRDRRRFTTGVQWADFPCEK